MQGHDQLKGDQQTMSCTVSQHKKQYLLKKSCPLASVPNIKQAAANTFSTSILKLPVNSVHTTYMYSHAL